MMKNIAVLGSTGSIGTQTLDVVRRFPERFHISVLSAEGNRPGLLGQQIAEFRPEMVAVFKEEAVEAVKEAAHAAAGGEAEGRELLSKVRFATGMEGLLEAASWEGVQLVVTALVGMIGIRPTVAAINAGKDIALANKETLVCAGALIMKLAKEKQVRILPVDSEHGAVFQCMNGVEHRQVTRLWLTASGGPFRGYSREQLEKVTLQQALRHPTWSMGGKITVDSASLMNKGLEMIEAKWLFDLDPSQVVPVIHPQSVIHSMIELTDGSVLAQMGPTDMRIPIEVALFWPERGGRVAEPLDFRRCRDLTFQEIDEKVFPSIAMAREAMTRGGLRPAVFNAANEAAVAAFRQERIGFTDIFRWVEKALSWYETLSPAEESYELADVLDICNRTGKLF